MIPRTILGRLLLVLFVSVAAAQVLVFQFLLRALPTPDSVASAGRWMHSVPAMINILEMLPPNARATMVSAALTDDPDISMQYPAEWVAQTPREFESLRRRLAAQLHNSEISLQAAARTPPSQRPGKVPAAMTAAVYDLRARLSDGSAARFILRERPPPVRPPWYSAFLPPHMLLLLVFLAGGIVVSVHQITRPLLRLVLSADALGKDFRQDPVPEEGTIEVRRLAQAFNRLRGRLLEYVGNRTRMLAAMSHDLRTPLTRLLLRVEIIDDLEQRTRFQQDLEEMRALVESTLSLLRGVLHEEPEFDLDVTTLLEELREEFAELKQVVVVSDASSSAPLRTHPRALKRCLRNLLDNAVKYGDRATVTVVSSDSVMWIEISDEGPGIPQAQLQEVLKPFYRVDSSRNSETGGLGLGLSIALEIVQALGGSISLHNRPQGGLLCVVELPLRKPPD